MNYRPIVAYLVIGSYCLLMSMCSKKVDIEKDESTKSCGEFELLFNNEKGCDGQTYLDPAVSPYELPFLSGTKIKMGLSNCSSSFHAAGQPDQYAYDFNFNEGTQFFAARAGTVAKVVNDQASTGGGAGNYLVIDHGDQTFGLYYHSPRDEILPSVGDQVIQGEWVGNVGRSGLAGYPHLHFIVVKDSFSYPFQGIPISFNNVFPPTVVLASGGEYEVCEK